LPDALYATHICPHILQVVYAFSILEFYCIAVEKKARQNISIGRDHFRVAVSRAFNVFAIFARVSFSSDFFDPRLASMPATSAGIPILYQLAKLVCKSLPLLRGKARMGIKNLMPEMSEASKHHRQTMLIRSCNNFLVTHRTAGLNHGFCTRLRQNIDPVAEREEGIG